MQHTVEQLQAANKAATASVITNDGHFKLVLSENTQLLSTLIIAQRANSKDLESIAAVFSEAIQQKLVAHHLAQKAPF